MQYSVVPDSSIWHTPLYSQLHDSGLGMIRLMHTVNFKVQNTAYIAHCFTTRPFIAKAESGLAARLKTIKGYSLWIEPPPRLWRILHRTVSPGHSS